MAPGDPTDPTSGLDLTGATDQADKATDSFNNLAGAQNEAKESLGAMSGVATVAQKVIGDLESRVAAYGFSLKNVGSLTQQQTAQFGLLSTAVLGTRTAFEGSGKGMLTFMDQFKEFQANLEASPAFRTIKDRAAALVDVLVKSNAPMEKIQEAAKGGVTGLSNYAKSFFESADNALRLQNAQMQLAASTGNMNTLFKMAGRDLGNINSVLSIQNKMINEASMATATLPKEMEKYYMLLGAVPKALESTVTSLDGTGKHMSMLTASMKLAHGTGRQYEDVVKDLHAAFKDYGITGESALKFTGRFSEISTKFGIELEDVRSGIMGATGAFKGMTDAGAASAKMTEAVTGLMNDYVDGLKKAGMTGPDAIKTVTSLTDGVKNLSTAQKAFLSAQTGGPGGLMGSFQIEKMMREGKIDQVFEKVRGTMQKQFGKIVTLDEASSSPQAAAQLQRQMMMLRQGPMGQMVKTDQDAYRLLETFRAKQEGRAPADRGAGGLDPKGLQKSIDVGTEFEKKSLTELHAANIHLDALRRAADIANLNTTQKASTAGTGAHRFLGGDTAAQREQRQNLTRAQKQAAYRSGATVENMVDRTKKGAPIIDMSGRQAAEAMNDFYKWAGQMKGTAKSIMDTLKQAVTSGNTKEAQTQVAKLEEDIKNRRAAAAKMPLAERQRALAEAQRDEDKLKAFKQKTGLTPTSAPTGADTAKLGDVSRRSVSRGLGPLPTNTASPAGATVGAAQRGAATPKKTGAAATTPGSPDVSVTETGSGGRIKVDVHVNVKDTGGQGQSVTPVGTP